MFSEFKAGTPFRETCAEPLPKSEIVIRKLPGPVFAKTCRQPIVAERITPPALTPVAAGVCRACNSNTTMANYNNFGTGEAGRARHSVRAVVCLAKGGAHRVTRPTFSVSQHECVHGIVKCHMF